MRHGQTGHYRILCPQSHISPVDQKVPAVFTYNKCHCGFLATAKAATGSPAHPLPHGLSWSILSGCAPTLLGPLFSATSMLVDFDRGAVQHQGRLIYNVLGNQFLKNVFPNTLLAPSLEPGVHTFPRAIPLRPVPPWDPCIQPVQYPIEHHPVVFSRPSSMLWLFRRQQLFHFFVSLLGLPFIWRHSLESV